jgi:hypothetical protein
MYNDLIGFMMQKTLIFLLLCIGFLLPASPSALHALKLGRDGLIPVSIPAGNAPVLPILQADLDGNGIQETLQLENTHLSIKTKGVTVWKSPQGWHVDQAEISDLDRNGNLEVTLLVWRPFQPWPADQWLPRGGRITGFQNAGGFSCHLIMVAWSRDGFHELWAGSALADPVTFFASADVNGDSHQELVLLEGQYADPAGAPAHTLKIWEWNGFGFTVLSSITGFFDKIALVQSRNGILILIP